MHLSFHGYRETLQLGVKPDRAGSLGPKRINAMNDAKNYSERWEVMWRGGSKEYEVKGGDGGTLQPGQCVANLVRCPDHATSLKCSTRSPGPLMPVAPLPTSKACWRASAAGRRSVKNVRLFQGAGVGMTSKRWRNTWHLPRDLSWRPRPSSPPKNTSNRGR